MNKLSEYFNRIGNIGIRHVDGISEQKSLRFLNYLCVITILLISIYATLSYAQFKFQYTTLYLIEISFLPILGFLLYLNHKGAIFLSKIIGLSCNLVYLFILNISSGKFMGGAFMLLATLGIPMLMFPKHPLKYVFFVLHILVFLLAYFYLMFLPSLMNIAPEDQVAAYLGAVVIMFVTSFVVIQYYLSIHHLYEDALSASHLKLEQKNREVTDSIVYANLIQSAILPRPELIESYFPDYFLLYRPKDIVAGDFYWIEKKDDFLHLAICDCTGHGVPGAMVSMICTTALGRALNEYHCRMPGEIFDKVRELLKQHFFHSPQEVYDGMDASLCTFDLKNKKMWWSGAYNPIWIIRNNNLIEIKGDKQPIGITTSPSPFSTHEISLLEGDCVYLFTDGFADQFGGQRGKKLGKKNFMDFLMDISSLSMAQQKSRLLEFHLDYRNTLEQVDDICVCGLRINSAFEGSKLV